MAWLLNHLVYMRVHYKDFQMLNCGVKTKRLLQLFCMCKIEAITNKCISSDLYHQCSIYTGCHTVEINEPHVKIINNKKIWTMTTDWKHAYLRTVRQHQHLYTSHIDQMIANKSNFDCGCNKYWISNHDLFFYQWYTGEHVVCSNQHYFF